MGVCRPASLFLIRRFDLEIQHVSRRNCTETNSKVSFAVEADAENMVSIRLILEYELVNQSLDIGPDLQEFLLSKLPYHPQWVRKARLYRAG